MSSNSTLIITLNNISTNLNQYFGIFIFLFGTVGNILNIFVLLQRPLRSNPCALLFLFSSVFSLITIVFGLTSRILAGWNIDPTNTIQWLCQLRVFVAFVARSAAYWLIMLASIDRWLLSSTHVHRRQMNTMKITRRNIIIIILFSIILYIQAPICYEISQNSFVLQCYGKTKECRMALDLTYAIISIFLPIFIMNLFTLKTFLNLHRTKFLIQPSHHRQMRHLPGSRINMFAQQWKKTDQRLLIMLFAQIVIFTLSTFPIAIQRIYNTVTLNNVKSDLDNAVDNFLYNLLFLVSFVGNGIPFYIYTLTGGKFFRKALLNVLHHIY